MYVFISINIVEFLQTPVEIDLPTLRQGGRDEGPNGSCLFAAGSPTDTVDGQSFWTFSTRQIAFLVALRSMPALLL